MVALIDVRFFKKGVDVEGELGFFLGPESKHWCPSPFSVPSKFVWQVKSLFIPVKTMAAQMDEESRLLNREAEVVAEVEEAEAMGQFGRGMWRYAAIALAATAIGSFGVTYSRQFQSASSASSSVSTRLQLAKEGKVKYTSLSTSEHADLFDEFKKTFGKDYDSKEEKERYSTFLTNLEKVDTRNEKERKAGGTAVHGITQFADISPGEFKKYYLGYVAPSAEAKAAVQPAKVEKYTGTAKSVNWANVYTTSINNQGTSFHDDPKFSFFAPHSPDSFFRALALPIHVSRLLRFVLGLLRGAAD